MNEVIARLLAEEAVQTVSPDARVIRLKLRQARAHLESAAAAFPVDPDGAYVILYEAARKAIDAHMLSQGLRTRAVPGAHKALVAYAQVALGREVPALDHLDRMRRVRNRSQYGAWNVDGSTVRADLEHARAIVEAVVAVVQS
jgi:hypothetical protein